MGGNKGKRTKGNVKPSSSGRTAELLSATGVTGFVGFTGLSSDFPGHVIPPGKLAENEEIDAKVDSDFKLVLKKATKRDTVTKIKALQEFSTLCQSKEEQDVKGALPYWPRLYIRLAIDPDRRVRELTHQAQKWLITKVKKSIAPYLKSIMGVWVVSMNDLHAPAASAAKQAFEVAFPPVKQAGVMDFCKEEIVLYIEDILFKQTATTLSDPKTLSVEEMEAKYIRLLAGCLSGIKFFLVTQGNLTNEKTEALVAGLMEEAKFWKYAKHKEPDVRKAWFSIIPVVCQYYPNLVKANAAKVCPLTFGQLGESNPIVAPIIWESILHIIAVVEDCWSHVNIKSAFLPQLWTVLSEAGNGNASETFPNLLPLLSKLPESVVEPRIPFYERFYGCFRKGMQFGKGVTWVSEKRAVIKSYFECMKYSLLRHLTSTEADIDARNHLISEQLVPLMKESFLNHESTIYLVLYCDLGDFLRFLDNKAQKEDSAILTETLRSFTTKLFEVSQEILENETPNQEKLLSRLSLFFHNLYSIGSNKKHSSVKRTISVQFQSEEQDGENNTKELPPETVANLSPIYKSYGVLAEDTLNFCRIAFLKLKETPKLPFLKLLSETIRVVPSVELFQELLFAQQSGDNEKRPDAPLQFVCLVLIPWLESGKEHFVGGDHKIVVECIVSIALSAYFCSPDDLALNLLDQVGKVQDPLVLETLVLQAAKLRKSEPRLRKWLKGDFVGKVMEDLANQLLEQLIIEESNSANLEIGRKLLNICFTATKDFDPLISSEYMNKILTMFTSALSKLVPSCHSNKLETSERIVILVCDLAVNLFQSCQGCWLLPAVESLLASLFDLSCCILDKKSTIATRLQKTWVLGTKRLVELQGFELKLDGFLYLATNSIKVALAEKEFTYESFGDVGFLSDTLSHFIRACVDGLRLKDENGSDKDISPMITEILKIVLPSVQNWNDAKDGLLKMFLVHSGWRLTTVTLPLFEIGLENFSSIASRYLIFSKFTADMLAILLDNWFIEIQNSDLRDEVLKHLQSLILAISFADHLLISPMVNKDSEISVFCSKLPETVSMFLEYLNFEMVEDVLTLIGGGSSAGSFSDSLTLISMVELCMKRFETSQKWCGTFFNSHELLRLSTEGHIGALNTIHCLIPYLSAFNIMELFTSAAHHLLCEETAVVKGTGSWCLDVMVICLNSKRPDIFAMESIQENLINTVEFLVNMRSNNPDILNPEWHDGTTASKNLEFVNQVSSIFYRAVKHFPQLLLQNMWDMILCVIVSWIQRCYDCKNRLLTDNTLSLPAIQIFQLLGLIQTTFSKLNSTGATGFMTSLVQEWEELYTGVIFSLVLPLFLDLGESISGVTQSAGTDRILSSISKLLNGLPADLILKCIKETATETEMIDNLPSELSFLLKRLHPLLMQGNRPLVFGSHAILFSIMHKIPEMQLIDDQNDDQQEEKSRPPPSLLVGTLQSTNQIVETMLLNFQIGDCCLVQPYTDGFTFTFIYLLAWTQTLELFGAATSEVRSEYAVFLDKSKLLDSLLQNLFRLMPCNPIFSPESQKGHLPSTIKTMFTEPLYSNVEEPATFAELQQLSCQVFLTALKQLPALVRQWWHNQDKRTAEIVNRYTTSYASSCISLQEIKAVQETETKFSNMTVKGRPVAREVVARYSMEEITIELVIKLPTNHPLGPVSVETSQRVGVGISQWRNWMLQLTTFLTHQNGSILDGLSLWKRNVDKRFEGIEECMICFYVLHGATCQLPKLTCRTCKKRFHSACLYKWFSTSQNATCPLCRNLF